MAEQLKLPEVARRLGVSEKTARRYVKSGALPSVFVGGAYRVSEEDLEEYLQDARVTPGGDSPKASTPPSPEPSFNDLLEEERRKREQLLVSLIVSFIERGRRLEETLKASSDSIPLDAVDEYAQNKAALQVSYEEMTSKGSVSKRLEEANRELDALDARINAQFKQLWSPGDVKHLLERGQFAGRRARIPHGAERIGEADITGEAG